MNSLYGYIGLSAQVSNVESGLYIDSLPDISLTIADKLTAENDFDVLSLYSKIEDRAIRKLRSLFINAVNKCHNVRDITVCDCLIESNFELLGTALWYLIGSEFMLERSFSSRLNRFTTIDKTKAKELKDEFLTLFGDELTMVVNSIDVNDNECSPTLIEESNIIRTAYVIP